MLEADGHGWVYLKLDWLKRNNSNLPSPNFEWLQVDHPQHCCPCRSTIDPSYSGPWGRGITWAYSGPLKPMSKKMCSIVVHLSSSARPWGWSHTHPQLHACTLTYTFVFTTMLGLKSNLVSKLECLLVHKYLGLEVLFPVWLWWSCLRKLCLVLLISSMNPYFV